MRCRTGAQLTIETARRRSDRRLRRAAGTGIDARAPRRAGGERSRASACPRGQAAPLRAVLHDEGARQGHRARACRRSTGSSSRAEAASRSGANLVSAPASRSTCHLSMPAAAPAPASPRPASGMPAGPRRFCSSKTTTPCVPSLSVSYSDADTQSWKRAWVPMASASRRRIARRFTS